MYCPRRASLIFAAKRLSTVFPPAAKLDFKVPPSGDVPAQPFQMPAAIKEKVGEPGEPGRSSAPPAVDQPQIPQLQPVKPPSPPPRPQLVYSHEVGTVMHTTHCVAFKEVVQIFGHENIFPCIASHCIFEGRVSQHVHRFILLWLVAWQKAENLVLLPVVGSRRQQQSIDNC